MRAVYEASDRGVRSPRLLDEPLTKEFLLSLEGIGWEGDLDELRDGAGCLKWVEE